MSGEMTDHPRRFALASELHARPFPIIAAPCRAHLLVIKRETDAAARDRAVDRAHLVALLDRHGAAHPPPDATHHSADLGAFRLKWECHTEVVTYMLLVEGAEERPFSETLADLVPAEWLAEVPGAVLTAARLHVEVGDDEAAIVERLRGWFVPESLAVSRILDGAAVMAGDFRPDGTGAMRFAIFAAPDTGAARTGRIIQRLCEVETYKALSMLGLDRARALSPQLGDQDQKLQALVGAMSSPGARAEETLDRLLGVATALEQLQARNAFRFSATEAYARLVAQRIEVLRETRIGGRQTFEEFMMRRFDPAMRTVAATRAQLDGLSVRARAAGDLLRTRVDVERSGHAQALLASMDRRADAQLRLQKTVEGLSVVAISYYAVSLAALVTAPWVERLGWDKGWTKAALVPVVVLAVWALVRRIRRRIE